MAVQRREHVNMTKLGIATANVTEMDQLVKRTHTHRNSGIKLPLNSTPDRLRQLQMAMVINEKDVSTAENVKV